MGFKWSHYIFLSTIFLVFWGFDYASKTLALSYFQEIYDFGFLRFHAFSQEGNLSSFKNEFDFILQIGFVTIGILLLFAYIFIQMFAGSESKALTLGVGLVMSGVAGKVTDFIIHGRPISFISLNFGFFSTPFFSLGDLIAWIGYALVGVGIYKYRDVFWSKGGIRKYKWINPGFQFKYIMSFVLFNLSFALVSGVFFYSFFQVFIKDLISGPNSFLIFSIFTFSYMIVTAQFCFVIWVVSNILSHRIAGPIFALSKYIDELEPQKENRIFKLRKTDEFFDLEDMAFKIKNLAEGKKPSSSESEESPN